MVPKSHLCRNEIYFDSIRVNAKSFSFLIPLLPHYYHAITTVLPQYYHYSQVHNVSSMLQQTFCPQLTTIRKSHSNHQANVPEALPNFAQGFALVPKIIG